MLDSPRIENTEQLVEITSFNIIEVDVGCGLGAAPGRELIFHGKIFRILLKKMTVDAISRVLDLTMSFNEYIEHFVLKITYQELNHMVGHKETVVHLPRLGLGWTFRGRF